MNQINKTNIRLSFVDIIRIVISLSILGVLLFLKDIFPDNPFVMKYFYGPYGIFWIIIFFVIFWKIEVSIARKRKDNDRKVDNFKY